MSLGKFITQSNIGEFDENEKINKIAIGINNYKIPEFGIDTVVRLC